MNEATARAMIQAHFDASNVGAAGGRRGDDIARASEMNADDAVVEWPQGGERLRGKANIIAFRSTYPARQQFELHRTTGCHDLWVNEYRPLLRPACDGRRDHGVPRRQGRPRADLLRRSLGAAGWRGHWVERFDPREPHSPVRGTGDRSAGPAEPGELTLGRTGANGRAPERPCHRQQPTEGP